jgi:hypothetical protein
LSNIVPRHDRSTRSGRSRVFSHPRRALALACLVSVAAEPLRAQRVEVPVEVTVEVDFGDRPRVVRKVAVERGADVVTATRAALPVEQDWLCCSPQDVWSIDGVGPDPRLDRYWSWRLGEAPGPNLPARHRLHGGETIVWNYGGGTLPNAGSVRVVSLLPAATEIAIAVGGEASLVALSHLCRQPDGKSLPRVMRTSIDSDTWSMGRIDEELRKAVGAGTPLYELDEASIKALRPTHVLSQGLCPVCAVTPEQVGTTLGKDAERCAQLVVLSPRSLADIANDIRTVGATVGREHAGKVAARAFERRCHSARVLPCWSGSIRCGPRASGSPRWSNSRAANRCWSARQSRRGASTGPSSRRKRPTSSCWRAARCRSNAPRAKCRRCSRTTNGRSCPRCRSSACS